MWSVPFSFSLLVVFLLKRFHAIFVCIIPMKTTPCIETTATYSPPVTPQSLREKMDAMPLRRR